MRLRIAVLFSARDAARLQRVAAKYGATPSQLVEEAVHEFLDAERAVKRSRQRAVKTNERTNERSKAWAAHAAR